MLSLETDRLVIRTFRPDDWEELLELSVRYQATESARYEDPWPTSAEAVKGMAAWFSSGEDYLAVCLRSTGRLIGLVAINRRPEQDGRVHNLGYVFHPDYHGQGYATESCRAAMAHLFGQSGADGILTGTRSANVASVRLLKRLGLHEKETATGEYSLSRNEWLGLEARQTDAGRRVRLPDVPSAELDSWATSTEPVEGFRSGPGSSAVDDTAICDASHMARAL